MNETKIRLSKKEKEMIVDSEWILTKNEIMKKINRLYENLNIEQQNILLASASFFPPEITVTSPKISRGENYKGLPWMVLDYPRVFQKENLPASPSLKLQRSKAGQAGICAIRTLFWWGNSFSVTLHLSGAFKKKFEEPIISSYLLLAKKKIYCSVNDDQWQHHFEKDNYALIKNMNEKDFEGIVKRKSFVKLAKRISLKKWEHASKILLNYFGMFITIMKSEN